VDIAHAPQLLPLFSLVPVIVVQRPWPPMSFVRMAPTHAVKAASR
jgi:hypothetical protein